MVGHKSPCVGFDVLGVEAPWQGDRNIRVAMLVLAGDKIIELRVRVVFTMIPVEAVVTHDNKHSVFEMGLETAKE